MIIKQPLNETSLVRWKNFKLLIHLAFFLSEWVRVKWRLAVTHTRNLCSAFNPSKCTAHTQQWKHTHPVQWETNAVAPGEQLGVRCLAQGSHLSRGIEGGESAGYSLPPPTIPAGPETRTRDLQVTSPTLYPLGHDCRNHGFFIYIKKGYSSPNMPTCPKCKRN